MKKNFALTFFILSFLVAFGIIFYSCKHDILYPADYGYKGPCNCPEDSFFQPVDKPCNKDTVYFQNQILPLIQSSCAIPSSNGLPSCHSSNPFEEAKVLTTYIAIKNSGYIKPKNASGSKMIESLTTTSSDDKMPPYPRTPLTAEQIDLITRWINQGALNNYCSGCDTSNVHFSSVIWPLVRDNCKGCHSGTTPSKNVFLDNYQNINAIVNDGRLVKVITGTGGLKRMPPSGALSPCKINQFNIWIANGAHND
jgi:hypothetical protein